MSTFGKKFVSVALTATTSVWMSGALLLLPVATHAQTAADLQALIASLQAQIAALQTKLGTPSGSMMSTSFTRDLTVGSRGDDVMALQQFLNSHGAQIAASGPGSPGSETTYFGSLTRAAVAQWQAANGISPAAGYVGPKTRAALAAMSGGTPPPVVVMPPPGVTPPPPGVVVPTSGLTVSLDAQSPSVGTMISSASTAAARVPVLAVNLTAGTAGGVTVTALNLTKMGVLADTAISSAYLIEKGKVLSQFTSISNGMVNFSGLNLGVNAGQTRTIWLAIDPATGLNAGNTVSFALASANDITTVDNTGGSIAETGNFPVNGGTFTVTTVSNPAIASLTIASSSIGSTVNAGTQNVIVGAWSFTGSNSKLNMKSIDFKVVGSATKTDLKNVKLYVNGSQVGSTLPSVDASGSAYFDLSTTPATINTGSNNVQVFADIMGSPSFNFQFEILNAYDVYVVDTQYNVPVAAASNTGTQVSINAGSITVTASTATPTGNIAKGQNAVTLAKFEINAAGEAVKVKFITFSLTFTGTTTTLSTSIKNIYMIDDAGNQIGSTISSPATSNSCDVTGTPTTAGYNDGGTAYTDCFGTSSSNINYVVPGNTTRVLSLRGDIQSGALFSTITGALVANTSNLQGLISSQTASTGAANGSALKLASSSLTLARNTAVGSQTYAAGATSQKIGSYSFSASSAEGVTVSNLTVTMGAAGAQFQNLMVKIGNSQFGGTIGTLANSGSYSFAGTPFTVSAGQVTDVDVYASILSSSAAGTKTAITTLAGCSASGLVSLSAVSCTSTAGQDVVVAGQATVTIGLDSNAAAAGQLVMGSSGNGLVTFRLTETSNIEDIKITDLNIFQQVATTSTVKSAFGQLSLYGPGSSSPLATASSPATAASSSNPGSGYIWAFHFTSPVVVPKSNTISLVLKGDVASYSSSGATDNTTHVFKISTSTDSTNDTLAETVVALGSTSNATSAVTLSSPNGNTMTVLRSNVVVTASPLGVTSGRSKNSTDDIGTLTFTANNAGSVAINSVIITFSGTGPSIATFLDGVNLYDPSTGSNQGTGNTTSSTACNGSNTCTKTFNLGSTTSGYVLSGSKTFNVRIDSTKTFAAPSGVSATLSATINGATDVRYTDALDGTGATAVGLPSTVVPISIQSYSYAQGT